MVGTLELKLCPNLDFIGHKIERDQFIEMAGDSEYKNKYFRFNVEDVILLHTIHFEKHNDGIQVFQVNLNDATVGHRAIEVITELIQRNNKYQAVIIYVYKEYLDGATFIPHYKVVVPKIHKGIKKDIFVVDNIAKTNLIPEYKLKRIFETFEEYIKNRNVPVNEVINRFYKHIEKGDYGYFECIKDREEEVEEWPIVASKWVDFIEKEALPEDPQIHIEDGFFYYEGDEYERNSDDAISDTIKEKYKQNWISKAKKWIIEDTLERYQDIYGYELIEDFFDMIFYDLEGQGNDSLLMELNEMYHCLGYGE